MLNILYGISFGLALTFMGLGVLDHPFKFFIILGMVMVYGRLPND